MPPRNVNKHTPHDTRTPHQSLTSVAMDSPRSPSPQAKAFPRRLDSSPFDPSSAFNSTNPLPFPRPAYASTIPISRTHNKYAATASSLRRPRSVAPSRSSSPTPSKFGTADLAIDLAKLGAKESDVTMPPLVEGSSEYEGPKDFTLNLESWIRGSKKWPQGGIHVEGEEEGEQEDGQNAEDQHEPQYEGPHDDQHPHEKEEADTLLDAENDSQDKMADESDFEPLGTSTPAPWTKQKSIGLESGSSTHERNLHATPEPPLSTETIPDSDEKIPDASESEPQSPSIPTTWANQQGNGYTSANAPQDRNFEARPVPRLDEETAPSTAGRGSNGCIYEPMGKYTAATSTNNSGNGSEAAGSTESGRPPPISRLNTEKIQNRAAEEVLDQISSLQAELEKLQLQDESNRYMNEMLKRAHVGDQEENGRLRADLRNLKEEAVKLQAQASALEKAMGMEQKARDDANAKVGSMQAKVELMAQELEVVQSKAEAQKSAADGKVAELQDKIRASQMNLVKELQEHKISHDSNHDVMQNLRSELQEQKTIQASNQSLINGLQSVLQEHKIVQESNQSVINELRTELDDSQRELSRLQQLFEDKLLAVQMELSKEQKLGRDVELLQANHEAELAELTLDLSTRERALHTCISQQEEEINKLEQEVEGIQGLESSLALKKMEIDHARDQLQDTSRKLESIQGENEKLKQASHRADRAEREKERFAEENERLQKENGEMSSLLNSKDVPMEAPQSTSEKISPAETLDSAFFTIFNKLKDGIKSHDAERSGFRAQIEALQAVLEQKHMNSVKEMKKGYEEELKSLKTAVIRAGQYVRKRESYNESLQQRIVSLETATDTAEKSHRESLVSLKEKIHSLEKAAGGAEKSHSDIVICMQRKITLCEKAAAAAERSYSQSVSSLQRNISSLEKDVAMARKSTLEQQEARNIARQKPSSKHRISRESIAEIRQLLASQEKALAAAKKNILDQAPQKPVRQQQTSDSHAPPENIAGTVREPNEIVRNLQSKYSSALANLQATRLALDETEMALSAERAKKNDNNAVGSRQFKQANEKLRQDLEAEFQTTIDEREKEWRRRMAVMFEEREKMEKALLWVWGKEELGDSAVKVGEGGEVKQGYRYRYV